MHLCDLNDDILRHICDFVAGKDALNLALASKCFHDHALNRVAAAFVSTHPKTLRAFHQHTLHLARPRAHYIEGIQLNYISLYRDEDVANFGNIDDYSCPFDDEMVQLLVDLLQNTRNLRRLIFLFRVNILLRSRIFDKLSTALTSSTLRGVQWVELNCVNSTIVELVGRTRWDLRVLSLGYQEAKDAGDRNSFLVLLDALTNFPNLHTLEIYTMANAKPPSSELVPPSTARLYLSIRRLYFECGTFPVLDFISRCPNVQIVSLYAIRLLLNRRQLGPAFRPFPPWPQLHHLSHDIQDLHDACCKHQLVDVSSVYRFRNTLHLAVADPDGEHQANVAMLLCVLRRLSPVWADLNLRVGAVPLRFWREVPDRAPRLRYLSLELSIPALEDEYSGWLDVIPDALSPLPLVYLGLRLHDVPERSPVRDPVSFEYRRDAQGEYVYDMTLDREARFREHCDTSALALPERCARAVPTLKFVQLFLTTKRGRLFAEEETGDTMDSLATDDRSPLTKPELRTITGIDTTCSEAPLWRIARVGERCSAQRLTAGHRRRLHSCLGMGLDGKDPSDELLTLYRDSDPAVS